MQGGEFNNWIIEQKLGEGGMGEVRLARHAVLNQPVAIKVIANKLLLLLLRAVFIFFRRFF